MKDEKQHYPRHGRGKHVQAEISGQELARLATVGLAHEHEHGGGDYGAELPEAEHVGQRHAIQHDVEGKANPAPHLGGNDREHRTSEINIKEELQLQVVVDILPLVVWKRKISAQYAQGIHREKENAILQQGQHEQSRNPTDKSHFLYIM